MTELDDRLPHPTHIGLNIAKAIPDDRPEPQDDGFRPHPDPAAVAAPIVEMLPEDGGLPSPAYLDRIAWEAGDTLSRVWELDQEAVVAWIRQALADGLGEGER